MKYETVVNRIGENLGPINYGYDFTKHDWNGSRGGVNPEATKASIEQLRRLEAALADTRNRVEVRLMHSDCYWPVLAVGMYDGWPFWEPTPSVMVYRVLGSEWHPWYYVQDVRVVDEGRLSDARFTPADQGKAIGSATQSSSSLLSPVEGRPCTCPPPSFAHQEHDSGCPKAIEGRPGEDHDDDQARTGEASTATSGVATASTNEKA